MEEEIEIKQHLIKALELYGELGFEYLPVKRKHVSGLISGIESGDTVEPHACENREQKSVDSVFKGGEELDRLRNDIGDCTRCKLSRGRKNIVFGEGNAGADIMFIGEGPGRDEDIQARPFVGDAGRLLTRLIEKLGMRRDDVYIANIVKCRPPNNRNPEEEEIVTCRPFVERQIEIVKPKVIVCLGRISAQSLLRSNVPISKLRGSFHDFNGIPVMPTFHPAYLLRNPRDKWLTWDDMQKVLEKLK